MKDKNTDLPSYEGNNNVTIHNKQSVDALIKTKTFRVYFNQTTWTASARGMYYASYNFSDFEISGKILSVDISDFSALRTTDMVQPMITSDTELGILSNVNTFANTSAGLYLRVAYI